MMTVHNFLADCVVAEEEFPEVSNWRVVVELDMELAYVRGVHWDYEERALVIVAGGK